MHSQPAGSKNMGIFSLLGSLIGAIAKSGQRRRPKAHYGSSKIKGMNAWKSGKKARGKWLPHDEYINQKRRK